MPLLLFGEYNEVVYITYTKATRDLPDMYALAEGRTWYNYYMYINLLSIFSCIFVTLWCTGLLVRKHLFDTNIGTNKVPQYRFYNLR